ncbi:amidase family protein [Lentibacillus amyloliquefaciens]|uniref:Amidase n=1 Tax=Lentibacillus amyloliquefaciens TaxID=1472767 RepID=A0A0U4G8L2_9BACI|nr:amidase family protein [Lentibacillus amyloliquefaciens]ALX49082.1 amidase [Lentibacillus amyloliquefaciens]
MDLQTYMKLDAIDIAELIRMNEMTSADFLELAFRRLNEVNSDLNAVVHDRKSRAVIEAKRNHGSQMFSGVPMLLKNLSQAVAGEYITSSSKLMKNMISEHDSNFVSRLRDAGFVFMGHTNTPEFGLKNITEPKIYGPTRNPWNINHSAGGSSGGSASAIASGVVPAAGASDGGGSIRIPASFTGLFGLKPTRGRTPVGPGSGRQWQGASIGFVLSRSVRDSAALLDVLQVVQPEAAFQTPLFPGEYKNLADVGFEKPIRIAYSTKSPVGTSVSSDAHEAVLKTVRWLEKEGYNVEEKENDVDGVQLMQDYYMMNSGEISALTSQLERSLGRALTPDDVELETWLLHKAGTSVLASDFSRSLASWDEATAKMEALHRTYDFFITPAAAYTAPEVGELTYSEDEQTGWRANMDKADKAEQQNIIWDLFLPSLTYTPFTQLANLTGQPAMSVPVHLSKDGLPMGVQVMASKGKEDMLLKLAYQMEQSDIWHGMTGNPMYKRWNSSL